VHAESSHWMHEISISKTVGHHFWPGWIARWYTGGTYIFKGGFICEILNPPWWSTWVTCSSSIYLNNFLWTIPEHWSNWTQILSSVTSILRNNGWGGGGVGSTPIPPINGSHDKVEWGESKVEPTNKRPFRFFHLFF
jgi:hypothetical protein